jgi:hypothetical protein
MRRLTSLPHSHVPPSPTHAVCSPACRCMQWAQLVRLELHYEEAHEAIAAAHGAYYYLRCVSQLVGLGDLVLLLPHVCS